VKQVCIDTHAIVFLLRRPKRLGPIAARVLRSADAGRTEVLIPAISVAELALLSEAGRDVVSPVQIEALVAQNPSFRMLPLDLSQCLEFALLGALRDPFDRLIVAAARTADVPLVTADETIRASGLVEALWD